MRIGILGGTYDPIHVGHLALAHAALRELKLDFLYFVPSSVPPTVGAEKCTTPAHLRFEMVERVVELIPEYRVSDVELKRGGISYTVDTIREFRREFPLPNELYFIVGGDWAHSLKKWKEIDIIQSLCQLVVATRPGFEGGLISDSIQILRFDAIDISSSRIREIVRQGKSLERWVPEAARRVIDQHQLYRKSL